MKQQNSCEPPPEKSDPVHEQRNSAESTNPGEDVPPPAVIVPPRPQGPQPPPDKDETRERRTERRDRIRLGVEISAVLVGLVGIGGLFITFQEMQETNRIARQALETQERPWIEVDVKLATPVIFYDHGGIYVGIDLLLKNVGHTVAIGIDRAVHIVPPFEEPATARNALCERRRFTGKTRHWGIILFPDNSITVKHWIHIAEMKDIQG